MEYLTKNIGCVIDTIAENIPIYKKNFQACPKSAQFVKAPIVQEMSSFIRVAGVSGAIAISLGAYGSHVLRDDRSIPDRRRTAFETGNRYHLIHSLALLAAPHARFPLVTAALFSAGMLLFCGPCYHYSITGVETTRRFTPIGGVALIIAWLSFIL